MTPKHGNDLRDLQAYADMFDLKLSDDELREVAPSVRAAFSGIAKLWDEDVNGVEMSVIFPSSPW